MMPTTVHTSELQIVSLLHIYLLCCFS